MRYRSVRPDDGVVRDRLRELAAVGPGSVIAGFPSCSGAEGIVRTLRSSVRIWPRPLAIANGRGSTRSRGYGGFRLQACLPVPRKKVDDFIG